MLTEFGRAIWELRTSNHDDVYDMEKKTGIDAFSIIEIEMGAIPLPEENIVDKILAAYKPNRSISYSLRHAFRRTRTEEKRKIEEEVYYWYAEEFHWDPSGIPCFNINSIFNGPFRSAGGALDHAGHKIRVDAVVYVFSCIKYQNPGSGSIAFKTICLRSGEVLTPPHKPAPLGYLLTFFDMMAAKKRFKKLFKSAILDRIYEKNMYLKGGWRTLMPTDFGDELQNIRFWLHEDIEDMAEKTGTTSRFIKSIENGAIPVPRRFCNKIIDAYRLSPRKANQLQKAFEKTQAIENHKKIPSYKFDENFRCEPNRYVR